MIHRPGQPLELAPGPQLLLDDLLVQDRCRLTRVQQEPRKHPASPIISCDQPWEGEVQQIGTVIWDERTGCYRMWYFSASRRRYFEVGPSESYIALATAESDDAIHWRKPLLDLCPYGDSPRTNFLHWGQGKPILNPDQSDPERRFLAAGLYYQVHSSGTRHDGLNLAHSADGLRWQVDGDYHLLDFHSDTRNHLVYDAIRGRWLLYCRAAISVSGRTGSGPYRRRVVVMISEDLTSWTYPEVVMYPDEEDLPDIDHCQIFRYGSHLLMFYAAMEAETTGRMHFRLASSADGIHWTRQNPRQDFIPLGPAGAPDAGIAGPAAAPLVMGDELYIYYNGMPNGQFEGGEGVERPWEGHGMLSTLPRDRFVAQRAGDEDGWLLTRLLRITGKALRINMAPRGPDAAVQVEVVRQPPVDGHTDYYFAHHATKGYTHAADGYGLDDCAPLTADALDAPVSWGDRDLGPLIGQAVYLRFRVRQADLFSFSITDE